MENRLDKCDILFFRRGLVQTGAMEEKRDAKQGFPDAQDFGVPAVDSGLPALSQRISTLRTQAFPDDRIHVAQGKDRCMELRTSGLFCRIRYNHQR